jgi:hypothetical protein
MPLRRWFLALLAPLLGGASAEAQQAADDALIVTGVTDAAGGGGMKAGDGQWHFTTSLVVWRAGDGPVKNQPLRLEMALPSDAALKRWMDEFPVGKGVRVRLVAAPTLHGNRYLAQFDKYLGPSTDAELSAKAEPILRPPPYHHPKLGRFVPDTRLPDMFEGQALWQGRQTKVVLMAGGSTTLDDRAETFLRLTSAQDQWAARSEDRIFEELYDVWNDNWRNDNQPKLVRKDWLARLRLQSIVVNEDGSFEFHYEDGDLFWGHAIMASGTFEDGVTHAEMWG